MSSEDEPIQRTAASGQQQQPLASPPPVPSTNSSASMSADASAPPTKEASGGAQSDGAGTPSTEIRSSILSSHKLTDEPKSVETPSSIFATPAAPTSNGSHAPSRPSRWTKARSTSTESFVSSMGIPATLGSQYNQEGFPNYPVSSEDEDGDVRIADDDETIAKQLARTDEAVRAINGTPNVVQRSFGNMMPSAPSSNQYELPRSAAVFVQRTARGDPRNERGEPKTGGSFVSSGSSTSSEESDFLPAVQWVNSVTQPNSTNISATASYPFYYTKPSGPSSSAMPPPSTIGNRRPSSPRRGSLNRLPSSGPATPNAAQHKLPSTHPSADIPMDGQGDNDEDDQTVGPREGSPSSSSASALDLLVAAVDHHDNQRNNRSYNTYLKRQQGAEAVAQWRQTAIPPAYDNSPGFEGTPPDGQAQDERSAEPPKKRRRTKPKLETPDPSLRNPPSDPSEDSDIESHGSASDSEYNAGKKRNRRNSNKDKGSRVRPTLPMPPAQPSPFSSKDSPAPTLKKVQPKQRRTSATSDSKPTAIPAGGVQCEYVNPLPPYQRCPDVFTRKYDIPRHMARHARREGDLVQEGKLPEEKALLWKTIRDKPRIRCKVCLEYFTRQDALKRHQNKQHHN